MISIEQVRALEGRVEKALAYIASLKNENTDLKRQLEKAEGNLGLAVTRANELEAAAEAFRRDQARIEEGIIHALEKLDAFEDLVIRAADAPVAAPRHSGAAPIVPLRAEEAERTADDLSLEELEAATAPEQAAYEAAAAEAAPATSPAANELDIF